MGIIDYDCGCQLRQDGIKLCVFHLALYSDILPETEKGWLDLSQECYNKIVHALNSEQEERDELAS